MMMMMMMPPHLRHSYGPYQIPFQGVGQHRIPFQGVGQHWIPFQGAGHHRVSFHGEDLSVTVTKRGVDVDRWVNKTLHDNRHYLRDLLVGLDTEWLPCLEGESNPAATLQLCVGHSCLIFQLLHRDYIPNSLIAFLRCPLFTFVGVGVQGDAEKLFEDHGLIVGEKVVDLRDLAAYAFGGSKAFLRMGLKKIAEKVIGEVMEKPLEVKLSKWDAKDLTLDQIEYGAIDAFASSLIATVLFTMAARRLHLK